jgi:RES domain-containing protein
MARRARRRDSALIDAIEAIAPERFESTAWRVVKDRRDPRQCSASGGRWDDGTFDVLYTSLERNGAIAEMHFHLGRGQPVFPSRVQYRLHELNVMAQRALKLLDLEALGKLGMTTKEFGKLAYQEKKAEYPRSQDIAEVAHFLEFDGLIVPCARWDCRNAVLFCDRVEFPDQDAVTDHGLVDWPAWIAANKR